MTALPSDVRDAVPPAPRWRLPPGLRTLASYRANLLRADALAGITLAAYLLPAALGDASLANLPPQAGLYACIFSGLVYWLFASSQHTSITVTSAISILIGSSLGSLTNDPARFGALAACTALLVGAIAVLVWLTGTGVVINFVSETVLIGFKCGIALVLASVQLPKLFGFKGGHGSFWECAWHFLSHLRETHLPSIAIGLPALAVLLIGKLFFKTRPVALIVVIAGIVIASATGLGDRGVKMLGHVPQGLPMLALPAVAPSELNELLPLAMACFLLGAVETAAIGRMFALKHRYRFDPNKEFLSLGLSNLSAGLGSGFPVSGGMSQSLVNEAGGARTSLSTLVGSLLILIVAIWFSDLLRNLPQPVLAAIVLVAVIGLVNVKAIVHLWHFSRTEFAVSMIALLGVLGSGILRGVLIGAVLSLILLLRRASRPQTTELGRVPGTDIFADLARNSIYERLPDALVFRVRGALLYFNIDYVLDRFMELLAHRHDLRLVIFYLDTVPTIDLAGAEFLTQLHHTLHDRGIDLRLADAPTEVRRALIRSGFEKTCGAVGENRSVADVVNDWRATRDRP